MSAVDLGEDAAGWLDLYRDLGRRMADLKEERELAREHLEAALGDAEEGLLDGKPAIRRTTFPVTRIDVRALRDQEPAVAERFSTTKPSTRFSVVEDDE